MCKTDSKYCRYNNDSCKDVYILISVTHEYVVCCAQLCLTLCDPVDCSPPGSSVRGISQARIMEWVAISPFRRSFWPGCECGSLSCLLHCRQILYPLSHWGSPLTQWVCYYTTKETLQMGLHCKFKNQEITIDYLSGSRAIQGGRRLRVTTGDVMPEIGVI